MYLERFRILNIFILTFVLQICIGNVEQKRTFPSRYSEFDRTERSLDDDQSSSRRHVKSSLHGITNKHSLKKGKMKVPSNASYYRTPGIHLKPPKASNDDYRLYTEQREHINRNAKLKLKLNDTLNIFEEKNANKSEKIRNDNASRRAKNHKQTVQDRSIGDSTYGNDRQQSKELEFSSQGDRIEFQIQGHEGPQTYIFGFDTGKGGNRQYRLEERLQDGTVKGHYGYYDARGKLRAVKYVARPFEGYQERHHERHGYKPEV